MIPMKPAPEPSEIPEIIRAAFADRAHLTPARIRQSLADDGENHPPAYRRWTTTVPRYRDGNGACAARLPLGGHRGVLPCDKTRGSIRRYDLERVGLRTAARAGIPKTIRGVKRKRSRRRSLGSLLSALDGSR